VTAVVATRVHADGFGSRLHCTAALCHVRRCPAKQVDANRVLTRSAATETDLLQVRTRRPTQLYVKEERSSATAEMADRGKATAENLSPTARLRGVLPFRERILTPSTIK